MAASKPITIVGGGLAGLTLGIGLREKYSARPFAARTTFTTDGRRNSSSVSIGLARVQTASGSRRRT